MDFTTIWLAILTVALLAHMFKDAAEFRRIAALEEQVKRLKESS